MRIPVALAASLVIAAPNPGFAQMWIGNVVGNAMAQQKAAQFEADCRAGTPASDANTARITAASDALIGAYLALNNASRPDKLHAVFAMGENDVSWKSPEGAVPVAELPHHLDAPQPVLTKAGFAVAGDSYTARGVWAASWPGDPARKAWYAVDFKRENPHIVGGWKFRIWHMTVFPADNRPAAPAPYCHFDAGKQ